jgi:predicted dehydrogenase
MNESTTNTSASRREFMKTTAGIAAAGGALAALGSPAFAHAAGSDVLRVGLIGCGGRGSGAAKQALLADENVKLTAMADAFEDRLDLSLKSLMAEEELAGKIDVPPEQRFVGFDAYKQLLATDVDVVLLTTPPHFRPLHLKAAIDAGKHVFAEKPVAVDAPGVRSVLETCAEAKRKQLSVVSGLCLRYDAGFRETVQRLHDGAIGDIHTLMANDYRGPIWTKARQPDWTDMHWQMRNWYYFTWLSGDFNVEQHVHYLDVCAWIMNGYPPKGHRHGRPPSTDGSHLRQHLRSSQRDLRIRKRDPHLQQHPPAAGLQKQHVRQGRRCERLGRGLREPAGDHFPILVAVPGQGEEYVPGRAR